MAMSRRTMLQASPAALGTALAPWPIQASPDAELIAACTGFVAADEAACAYTDSLPADATPEQAAQEQALTARCWALFNQVIRLPARTPAGLRAKAETVRYFLGYVSDAAVTLDHALIWSLTHDLMVLDGQSPDSAPALIGEAA